MVSGEKPILLLFSALLYLNDAIIIVLIVQWEINNPSCFMNNRTLVAVRLTFGYKFVFANVIYFQPNTAESQFRKKSNIYFFRLFYRYRIVSQVWCSFITFPLYVIITQVKLLHRYVRTFNNLVHV
jgi:hypothetical protein